MSPLGSETGRSSLSSPAGKNNAAGRPAAKLKMSYILRLSVYKLPFVGV